MSIEELDKLHADAVAFYENAVEGVRAKRAWNFAIRKAWPELRQQLAAAEDTCRRLEDGNMVLASKLAAEARCERLVEPECLESESLRVIELQNRCERLEQYKMLFNHALACVDSIFQVDSAKPPPLLPDYCQIGEDKFRACIRLAKDYLAVNARCERLEALCKSFSNLARFHEYAGRFYTPDEMAEVIRRDREEIAAAKEG